MKTIQIPTFTFAIVATGSIRAQQPTPPALESMEAALAQASESA
jgi:hypothetical protein